MQTYFVLVRNREDSERPEDDGWWMDYLPHHQRMQVLEVADDEGISETEALLMLLQRDEQVDATVIGPDSQEDVLLDTSLIAPKPRRAD